MVLLSNIEIISLLQADFLQKNKKCVFLREYKWSKREAEGLVVSTKIAFDNLVIENDAENKL